MLLRSRHEALEYVFVLNIKPSPSLFSGLESPGDNTAGFVSRSHANGFYLFTFDFVERFIDRSEIGLFGNKAAKPGKVFGEFFTL